MTDFRGIQSEPIVLLPSPKGGKDLSLSVKVGEELIAQVVNKLKADHYLIRVRNLEVAVQSRLPLTKGEQIPLRVAQTSPQIVLIPIPQAEEATAPGVIRISPQALGQESPVGESFNALRQALSALTEETLQRIGKEGIQRLFDMMTSLTLRKGTSSEDVRNALTKGGLFFESDLGKALLASPKEAAQAFQDVPKADLKGTLLQLSKKLHELMTTLKGGTGKNQTANLLEVMEGQIKTIEAKQVLNHLLIQNDKPMHFQIPFSLGGTLQTLDLYYQKLSPEEEKEKGAYTDGFKMVFLMELENLGLVRTDVLLKRRKIDCVFIVEKKDLSDLINASLEPLVQGLQEKGLSIGTLRSTVGEQEEIREIDTEEKSFLKEVPLVDLRI